jgi:general secretion pathway protein C
MVSALSTFLIWGCVALSALYWALGGVGRGSAVVPPPAQAASADPARADWRRVMGGSAAAPASVTVAAPAPSAIPPELAAFRLQGIVATAKTGRGGVALLAQGDQPARPLTVGQVLTGDWVLKSLAARSVQVGPKKGPAQFTLNLPQPMPSTSAGPAGRPSAGAAPVPTGSPVAAIEPIVSALEPASAASPNEAPGPAGPAQESPEGDDAMPPPPAPNPGRPNVTIRPPGRSSAL